MIGRKNKKLREVGNMDIVPFTVDGTFTNCHRCGQPNFIKSLKVAECYDDGWNTVHYQCSNCTYGNQTPVEEVQGPRKESLYRITITG